MGTARSIKWSMKFRKLRKVTAVFLTGLLLLAFFGIQPAQAAPGQQDYQKAFDFMHNLGCASGSPDGQAHLSDNLTRAQAAALLVKCMGQDANAKILTGAAAFPDTETDWSSGYVAVAKNMGWVNGMPDGMFHPNDKVTVAQLLSMLDNALGLQVNKSLGWPNSVIAAAEDAGYVSKSDGIENLADVFAPRGEAFFFANSAFMNVQLANGKTVYQTYTKTSGPSLTVSVQGANPTTEAQAVLTGTANNATSVTVNSEAVTLGAGGSFSYTVQLNNIGENVFKVIAADAVNNNATQTITITRSPKLTKLTVSPGGTIQNNLSVPVAFNATSEYDNGLTNQSEQVAWSVSPNTATITDKGVASFSSYGTYTITAEKDGVTGTSTVQIVPPPIVYTTAPQELKVHAFHDIKTPEGIQISFKPEVTGNRSDNLSFKATGLPDGVNINEHTGEISGTVATSNVLGVTEKQFNVTITVSDGSSSSSQSFIWTLTNVDQPL